MTNEKQKPEADNARRTIGVGSGDLLGVRLNARWTDSSAIWYRFARLGLIADRRRDLEIPLGFRLVFITDCLYIEQWLKNLRLQQNGILPCRAKIRERRLQFYQRCLDPMVLPVMRLLLPLLNLVLKEPDSGEVITASSPGEPLGQDIVDKIVAVAPESSLGRARYHFAVIEGSLTIAQCKGSR